MRQLERLAAATDGNDHQHAHAAAFADGDADVIEYRASLDPAALAKVDRVEVTAYYQSIPPFYLQERFQNSALGPAREDTKRLYYMTSPLDIAGATNGAGDSVLDGWKLRLTGATRKLGR